MKKSLLAFAFFFALWGLSGALAEDAREALSAYDPVLDMVIAGLSGDEAIQESDDFNISMLQCALTAGTDPMKSVGLEYMDLDGDSVPELILGQTENEWEDRFLFDIWALSDGEPVLAARGWERNRLYLTYDFMSGTYSLYNEGSNSAFESLWRTGAIADGKADWTHTLVYNGETETVWTLDGDPIPEEEAEALQEEWREGLMDPELFYLSARDEAKLMYGSEGDFPDLSGFPDFPDEPGQPEEKFLVSGRITENGPAITVLVKDTGEFAGAADEPDHVLEVSITAEGGNALQTFTYDSAEMPGGLEPSAADRLARFADVNFDGFQDLVLLTALGVYNEFDVFCLWNPETGKFDPVMKSSPWSFEKEAFDNATAPLELCNFELLPGRDGLSGVLLSTERDGYANYRYLAYRWEAPGFPALAAAFEVFGAGKDRIGDRLYRFASQVEKLWEHVYPENWYYELTNRHDGRKEAFLELLWKAPETATVQKTNWVNLREMDTTKSKSLAKLPAGTEVQVLRRDISRGWDLVLWDTGKPDGVFFGNRREIGYIQNRFLTK